MAVELYSDDDESPWDDLIIRSAACIMLVVAIVLCVHHTWPRLALWYQMPHWLYHALGFPFSNWINAMLGAAMSAIISAAMLYTGRRDGGIGVHYDANLFVASCAVLVYVLLEMT